MDGFAGHEWLIEGVVQIILCVWYASKVTAKTTENTRRIESLETSQAVDRSTINQNNALLQRIDERTVMIARGMRVVGTDNG